MKCWIKYLFLWHPYYILSAKEGFKLNNLPLKLKGGCVHHDNGLLGAASVIGRRRVK